MTNCTDCMLDGTDACPRGSGRAIDDETCEEYLRKPYISEQEGVLLSEKEDFDHEGFYNFLLNTIQPNEMEKYRSMFLSSGEIVN